MARSAVIRDGLNPQSRIVYRPFWAVLVPPAWHRGRVVMIGDAVHATTPHLASGAGIGIEDAIVLAQELERNDDVEQALTAFTARRYERCRTVVENSLRLGDMERHRCIEGRTRATDARDDGRAAGADLMSTTSPTSQAHYRAGPALLHWTTAALILVMVPLGALLGDMPRVQATFKYYSLHKWIGIVVFVLTCVRLLLRWLSPPPPLPASMPMWQQRVSALVHGLLYTLLLALRLGAVLKHHYFDRDHIVSRMVDGLRRGQSRCRFGPWNY